MQAVHPIGYIRLQGQRFYNKHRFIRIIRHAFAPVLLTASILFCTFITVEETDDPSWHFETLSASPTTLQASAVTAYYSSAPKEPPTTPEQNAISSANWLVTETSDIRLNRALSIYNYIANHFLERRETVVGSYAGNAFDLYDLASIDFTDVDMRLWAVGMVATIAYESQDVINGDDVLYSADVIENWHIKDVPAKWGALSFEQKEDILLHDYPSKSAYGWFKNNCYAQYVFTNSQFVGQWGYGLGSWTGPVRIAYTYWAQETGRDFRSLETMLDYHLFETFTKSYRCEGVYSTYPHKSMQRIVDVLRGKEFNLENAKIAVQLLYTYRMYYGSFPGANKWQSMTSRNPALTNNSNWLNSGMTMWDALNAFDQQGVRAFS